MNDSQSALALAVLPHLTHADRLIDALHRDGHPLEGILLLGGDARTTSRARVLLSTPGETPLWHVPDCASGSAPRLADAVLAPTILAAAARERIARVTHDLADIWQELHDEHLGGSAVLGLLPLIDNSRLEARFARTVLDHAHGFFGVFELLGPPGHR